MIDEIAVNVIAALLFVAGLVGLVGWVIWVCVPVRSPSKELRASLEDSDTEYAEYKRQRERDLFEKRLGNRDQINEWDRAFAMAQLASGEKLSHLQAMTEGGRRALREWRGAEAWAAIDGDRSTIETWAGPVREVRHDD